MTIPAGYSKVRMTEFDAIVNVSNDVVGMVDADGTEVWFAQNAYDASGNIKAIGADLFNAFLAITQMPTQAATSIANSGLSPMMVLALIPLRPGRHEPRVKKHLKYRYAPMTVKREIMLKKPYLYADKLK